MKQEIQEQVDKISGLTLENAGEIAMLSACAAIIRLILGKECRNCKRMLANLALGMFAGGITWMICLAFHLEIDATHAIVGIVILLARDLITATLKLGKGLSEDPMEFIENISNIVRKK